MENTLKNKAMFFAQYWGQSVLNSDEYGIEPIEYYFNPGQSNVDGLKGRNYHLLLKSLSLISDSEIVEVLRLAHNLKSVSELECAIKREKDIIHCWFPSSIIGAEYHVCLNFKYATINANIHFKEIDNDVGSSNKVNIGEIHFSASRVVGYIQVVDFLRSKGYGIPFGELSIKTLLTYGWMKFQN
jgi:hypothetical protein